MLYSLTRVSTLDKRLKNKRLRLNLRDRRAGFPLPRFNSYPSGKSFLQIPLGWDFIALRQPSSPFTDTRFYAYTDTYFINIGTISSTRCLNYNPQTRVISFFYLTSSPICQSFVRALGLTLSRFYRPFFLKVRFKGKGYYMYKSRRNTIAPQFGYAHRVYVYAQATSVKFLSKTKVLIFGLSKRDIFIAAHSIKKTKPINIFTGRGVRFARQIIYRKTGKVSSYR